MSTLRVNRITNQNNNGPVEFSKGIILTDQYNNLNTNINVTGIVTATTFSGDGSRISGFITNEITNSKAIAFSIIA